jgi:hypothetical protein
MAVVAESDTPPEGYYEKDGDIDLAPALRNAVNNLHSLFPNSNNKTDVMSVKSRKN